MMQCRDNCFPLPNGCRKISSLIKFVIGVSDPPFDWIKRMTGIAAIPVKHRILEAFAATGKPIEMTGKNHAIVIDWNIRHKFEPLTYQQVN